MINYMGYELYLSDNTNDNFTYTTYHGMTHDEFNTFSLLFDNDDNIKTVLATRVVGVIGQYMVKINTHKPLSNKPPKVKVSVGIKNSETIHFSNVNGFNYIPTLNSYTILDNGCTIASFNVDSINFIYEQDNQCDLKSKELTKTKIKKGIWK